jgi:hypothetical protein
MNMITVQNFELVLDNYNIMCICTSATYAQKKGTQFYDY